MWNERNFTAYMSVYPRIAKVLNTPTAYFYAEDDVLAEIIGLYGKLPKDKQKELLMMIKQFGS